MDVEGAPLVGGFGRRALDDGISADDGFAQALVPELPRLRRTARLLVGSAEAADDLVGDAIARVLPKWRSGSVDEPIGYVRRAMVNLATKRWRRRAVGRRLDHRALDWSPLTTAADTQIAERDAVLTALAELAPRRRAVVVLRFYEDRSIDEIADLMGCAPGTVKSQLSRGLGQLATRLEGPEG